MNKLAFSILWFGLIFSGCEVDKSKSTDIPPNPERESLSRIPEGSAVRDWIYLEKSNWLPSLDEVSRQVRQSADALESGNFKSASQEFQKLITLMKSRKTAAKGAGLKTAHAVTELEKMAKTLGAAKPEAHLQKAYDALSRAYIADLSEGFVPSHPENWKTLQKEIEIYFSASRQEFEAKEKVKAAVDLRRSLIFLKMEAVRANQKSKDLLFSAVLGIAQLAAAVEKDAAVSAAVFDRYLSRGHQAMSSSHTFQAAQKMGEKKQAEAELEFQTALFHLRRAGELAAFKFSKPVDVLVTQGTAVKKGLSGKKASNAFEKSVSQVEEALAALDKKTAPSE